MNQFTTKQKELIEQSIELFKKFTPQKDRAKYNKEFEEIQNILWRE